MTFKVYALEIIFLGWKPPKEITRKIFLAHDIQRLHWNGKKMSSLSTIYEENLCTPYTVDSNYHCWCQLDQMGPWIL